MPQLDREQLVAMVERIMSARGCEIDLDALLTEFEQNVPHPNPAQLIFAPADGVARTPCQIVDLALNPPH